MIYNSDELNRRTLNFPAVKPCSSVAPTTLITSLLSLSTQITAFKQHNFTSNHRNANQTIRLINILQIIIESIRDDPNSNPGLPKPAMESLLNLHVVLQKIHFLLQAATCPDARVWMLINSGPIAAHFRDLVESISAVLDGFPAELTGGFDDEVMDYVSYVISHAKTAEFKVDSDDLEVCDLIAFALEKFEKRVIPNPNDLRRVMDYLGIEKWSDCNKQVKFLEEEVGSGSEPGNSLLGFMVYCRCVLFHSIDDEVDKKLEEKKDYIRGLNPDEFKCPISLEIMSDPVVISSGQTYDRSSILKWFKLGNPVCPKTGQKLESLDLVPNMAVKVICKQYCSENGISFPVCKIEAKERRRVITNCPYEGSLAAQEATRMVADFLSIKLAMGTNMAERSKAAYEIRLLAKRSTFNRACFVESGALPYLLNLLRDSTAQEDSIAALLILSKHAQSKAAIVENGGLALVVWVLKSGVKIEARQHAAATLFYLSSVEEYRRLIGTNPDAVPSLVELIRVGGDRGKRNALVTIFGLLMLSSNHFRVIEAKLVPVLASALGGMENEELIVDSLAVLVALAEKPEEARAILHARALNIIIQLLCSSSSDSSRIGREHCVSVLLALCLNCGIEVVEVLVKNTSLTGVLYSLLIEGTSRASKKARSLISVLHQFSESRSSSSPSMAHALPHENFTHVW